MAEGTDTPPRQTTPCSTPRRPGHLPPLTVTPGLGKGDPEMEKRMASYFDAADLPDVSLSMVSHRNLRKVDCGASFDDQKSTHYPRNMRHYQLDGGKGDSVNKTSGSDLPASGFVSSEQVVGIQSPTHNLRKMVAEKSPTGVMQTRKKRNPVKQQVDGTKAAQGGSPRIDKIRSDNQQVRKQVGHRAKRKSILPAFGLFTIDELPEVKSPCNTPESPQTREQVFANEHQEKEKDLAGGDAQEDSIKATCTDSQPPDARNFSEQPVRAEISKDDLRIVTAEKPPVRIPLRRGRKRNLVRHRVVCTVTPEHEKASSSRAIPSMYHDDWMETVKVQTQALRPPARKPPRPSSVQRNPYGPALLIAQWKEKQVMANKGRYMLPEKKPGLEEEGRPGPAPRSPQEARGRKHSL